MPISFWSNDKSIELPSFRRQCTKRRTPGYGAMWDCCFLTVEDTTAFCDIQVFPEFSSGFCQESCSLCHSIYADFQGRGSFSLPRMDNDDTTENLDACLCKPGDKRKEAKEHVYFRSHRQEFVAKNCNHDEVCWRLFFCEQRKAETEKQRQRRRICMILATWQSRAQKHGMPIGQRRLKYRYVCVSRSFRKEFWR